MRLISFQRNNGLGHVLFFVLSGALISSIIRESKAAENRYSGFLLRRMLRIFPLYFGYLALAAVLTRLLTGSFPLHLWVFALFLQNVLYHTTEATQSVLETYHLWSIAVQDQFYLLWPLFLWRCKTVRQMRLLCCAGIALSLLVRIASFHLGAEPEMVLRSLPGVAGCMCLGCLLSLEWSHPTRLTTFLRRSFVPLLAVCLAWMWVGMDYRSPGGGIVGYYLVAIVCAGMISTATDPTSVLSSILGTRAIAFCGRNLSYGIYMFHPALLNVFSSHYTVESKVLRHLVVLGCTMVLAWLSYRYLEMPFIRLKRRKRAAGTDDKAPPGGERPIGLSA